MSGRVVVVTDSTACLPPGMAEQAGITVVPLEVVIRGEPYVEGTPAAATMLREALRRRWPATTSRPGPRRFLDVYQKLAAEGATAIVSVHLSALLSGTYDSAVLAAKDAPVPVTVLDSHTLSLALGFAALSAAAEAARGADAETVAREARRVSNGAAVLFYVDTLEYLRLGGRVGAARAMVGTALAMKPLLHVAGGQVAPLERVRTSARGIARLEEIAVEHADSHDLSPRLAVHHLDAAERAEQLAARLAARLPDCAPPIVSEVGAVLGAHVGPGVLGVVIAPR
jgi:DegV family protein with EDD domain